MKNFHIRYECNDARDDFASQRKQMTGSHKYPIHLDNDDMNEFDAQNVLFEYGATQENMTDEMVKGEDWKTKSRAEILRLGRNEMIMRSSGWLDQLQGNGSGNASTLPNQIHMPHAPEGGTSWKTLLEDKRQEILLKEHLHGHVTTGEAGFEMAPTSATQCQIDAGLFRLALISQKGNKLCT